MSAAARPQSPLPQEACRTAGRLLDEAEKLFARKGFAATSIRDVTAAAGCNVASVHYHFGGKEALYAAMHRRRLADMRERHVASLRAARAKHGGAPTLEDVVRAFAETYLEPFGDRVRGARHLRLVAWEMADPRLPAGVFRDEYVDPVRRAFLDALRATGTDVPERTARQCASSLIGQLVHAVQLADRLERASDRELNGLGRDQLLDHVVRFTAAGIRARAHGAPIRSSHPARRRPRGRAVPT